MKDIKHDLYKAVDFMTAFLHAYRGDVSAPRPLIALALRGIIDGDYLKINNRDDLIKWCKQFESGGNPTL